MGGRFGIKRCIFLLLALLLLYLSLYTWNLRSGFLDSLATNTGMEIAGLVLKPGKWVAHQATSFWDRYIYFVGLRQQNEQLQSLLARLHLENADLREQAHKAALLERLMEFSPAAQVEPPGRKGCSPPNGSHGRPGHPAGRQGHIRRRGPRHPGHHSRRSGRTGAQGRSHQQHDPASDRPQQPYCRARTKKNRTSGILTGQGAALGTGESLNVLYVPLNAPLEEGEILITSGLAGLFPPGLPVARIERIERSDISLFQTVLATPIAQVREVENLLLLNRVPDEPSSSPPRTNSTSPTTEPGAVQ